MNELGQLEVFAADQHMGTSSNRIQYVQSYFTTRRALIPIAKPPNQYPNDKYV
jgi:hypothetical protein